MVEKPLNYHLSGQAQHYSYRLFCGRGKMWDYINVFLLPILNNPFNKKDFYCSSIFMHFTQFSLRPVLNVNQMFSALYESHPNGSNDTCVSKEYNDRGKFWFAPYLLFQITYLLWNKFSIIIILKQENFFYLKMRNNYANGPF